MEKIPMRGFVFFGITDLGFSFFLVRGGEEGERTGPRSPTRVQVFARILGCVYGGQPSVILRVTAP